MEVANILKIVDIESTEFYSEFIKWLNKEIEPTYRDQDLKEHIYNVGNIIDNQNEAEAPMFISQLNEIQTLCNDNEAGYFRITY